MNESKEKLPIEFITSFISKGWDEIGVINASIEGIKKEFKNTKNVEEALQDLADAYLICIGRLEGYLDNKNYVDMPEEKEIAESLTEAIELDQPVEEVSKEEQKEEEIVEDLCEEDKHEPEAFEYFVDFDEPEPDIEADNVVKAWLNRA